MQESLRLESNKRKELRVEKFLREMDLVVPWDGLREAIEPHYKAGVGGRKPHDLGLMLRVHFLQLWHNSRNRHASGMA